MVCYCASDIADCDICVIGIVYLVFYGASVIADYAIRAICIGSDFYGVSDFSCRLQYRWGSDISTDYNICAL